MTRREELLECWLYRAILLWYENSSTKYSGLDDETFITKVCNFIGLSREEYKKIMDI